MDTFYLIDFENVHNDGIANINSLSKDEHVHIFSTQNALEIRPDVFWLNNVDIKAHLVPVRKQSVDLHLVSYLGHLLAIHGKKCAYIIVSKDKDYDNIINFWKKEGYTNISRKSEIPSKKNTQTKTVNQSATTKTMTNTQTINNKISAGKECKFTGDDRSELNLFMQHALLEMGYSRNEANKVCKYVVANCNDERMLNGIHNDLKREWDDCSEIYKDVKTILGAFVSFKNKVEKRESQVRSFLGQHIKKKIYVDHKEEIVQIILSAQTKQQVNNKLLELYADGNVVKQIYQTVNPLIKDLPGK